MASNRKPPDRKPPAAIIDSTSSLSASYAAYTVTFLLAMTYIAIAVMGTTDAQLLLDMSVTLPFISVGVPAKLFYTAVPLFLIGLHINVLFFESILESRLAEWNIEDNESVDSIYPSLPIVRRFGGKAAPAPLAQSFARLWYWTIIGYLPPCLLVLMQAQFVRAHHGAITCFHQSMIVGEIVIVAIILVRNLRNQGKRWTESRRRSRIGPIRSRTSWRDPEGQWLAYLRTWVNACLFCALAILLLTASFKILVFRDCEALGKPHWLAEPLSRWFPSSLRLRGVIVDPGDKDSQHGYVDLRQRDLQCAEFSEGKLVNVDFRGANLTGATFVGTDLRRADFSALPAKERKAGEIADCTPDGHWEAVTDLTGVRFINTNLTATRFGNGSMKRLAIQGGVLTGADFCFARLPQARLERISAVGARFEGASLRGVTCSDCQLQFADFDRTDMSDSTFVEAKLLGASFVDTELDGADLKGADLTGARLSGLTAIDLRNARLVGADFCSGGEMPLKLVDFRGVILSPPDSDAAGTKQVTGAVAVKDMPYIPTAFEARKDLDKRLGLPADATPTEQKARQAEKGNLDDADGVASWAAAADQARKAIAAEELSGIPTVAEARERIGKAAGRISELSRNHGFARCLELPGDLAEKKSILIDRAILYDDEGRDKLLASWPAASLRETDFRRRRLDRQLARACRDNELFEIIKSKVLDGGSSQDLELRREWARRLSRSAVSLELCGVEGGLSLDRATQLSFQRIAAVLEWDARALKYW